MSNIVHSVSWLRKSFWNEHVWLPPNAHWHEFPNFNDLYYSIITATILIFIRFTFERYLYAPIGIKFGLKAFRSKKAPDNLILEDAFRKNPVIGHKQIQALAKKADMTERQVQRWMRQRRVQNKPTTLTRFTESAWRCSFYSFAFAYGLYTLSDKPWLYDSIHCFLKYPHHSISPAEWWYYNIELGFYLSLIVSQFFDIQRKDFWQMFAHHVVTIMLLAFSWACNLVRIGTLVLVIHDFADIPLEGAKLTRYLKMNHLSNPIFAIFTVCWIFSRLGLLPYRVIAYSTYYALDVVPMFPAYYIFNTLLCALQVLHVVWTWLILKIALNVLKTDEMKDLRESEETSEDITEDSLKSSENELVNGSPQRPSYSMNGAAGSLNGNNNEVKTINSSVME